MIRILTPLGILLFITIGVMNAQEPVPVTRSQNKVIIEGKVYYVHVVKAGQTLYSIGRAYNVSDKELIIENPGISTTELRIGHVLKIPAVTTPAFEVDTHEEMTDTNIHVIREGETIYSISRKYRMSVESVIAENPGIDINDLQVGQEIFIPLKKPENEFAFDEEGLIHHKVKRRETLFSISRYYGVTIEEIRKLNPELGWGGPRAGDVLRIPEPNTTSGEVFGQKPAKVSAEMRDTIPPGKADTLDFPDAIVEADTLIEADTLVEEPYTFDWLRKEEFDPYRLYRIAYMIPFDYQEPEPLDSLLKNVRSQGRRMRITEQYELEQSKPGSVNFLEFFEGSLMAIDSLTDAGLNLEVSFFDTHKSMFHTRRLLENPSMKDMDLIIGPFFSYNLELVSAFADEHHIPVVTPFYSGDSLINSNPWLFQVTPSYQTEYQENARFIARHHDKNLIFVHAGDSSEIERINHYKEALFDEFREYSALETVVFKEVIIKNGDTEELVHALSSDLDNIVILPSRDEAFASRIASRLFYLLKDYSVQIYGSPYWVGFDDIQVDYVHSLQLVISHTHWYDYNDPEYLDFLDRYRSHFFREPMSKTRKGCNYAITGYDISFYFLSALQRYGRGFVLEIGDHHPAETLCDFSFERTSPYGGFENRSLRFFKFNPDLTVTRIELPVKPPVHYYLQPAEERLPLFFRQERDRQD